VTEEFRANRSLAARIDRKFSRLWVALIVLAGGGCASGTETGNPSITGQLSYTGYSSNPSEVGLRVGGSLATVKSAWFDLERIDVSAAGSCGTGAAPAFVVPALGLGDHASGNHNSTAFEARDGSFCGLDVPFALVADASGAPAALLGRAFLVSGEVPDGTPFTIVSEAAPVVRLQATKGSFSLPESEPDLLLGFDFATWLSGLDFAGADRTAGAILISKDSNPALLQSFDAALARGLHLYRDRDGDGALDENPELLAGPD
jgi:hypothetical protein